MGAAAVPGERQRPVEAQCRAAAQPVGAQAGRAPVDEDRVSGAGQQQRRVEVDARLVLRPAAVVGFKAERRDEPLCAVHSAYNVQRLTSLTLQLIEGVSMVGVMELSLTLFWC